LLLGALTRHRRIETDPAIAAACPLLAAAAPHIAHLPIRTRGTLGGSLAHADPAAEWPAICLACDAVMHIAGPTGTRQIAAADWGQGVFATSLQAGELLTAIEFPAWPANRRHGFREIARRRGDFAMVGAAVTLVLDAGGTCTDARVVLFGATDRAMRRPAAEAVLVGAVPDAARLRDAAALAAEGLDWNTDLHASADYRRRVAPVMLRRAMEDALGLSAAQAAA
jgi:carbon-monoxide dehydrogenase medium subunit